MIDFKGICSFYGAHLYNYFSNAEGPQGQDQLQIIRREARPVRGKTGQNVLEVRRRMG